MSVLAPVPGTVGVIIIIVTIFNSATLLIAGELRCRCLLFLCLLPQLDTSFTAFGNSFFNKLCFGNVAVSCFFLLPPTLALRKRLTGIPSCAIIN